MPNTIAYAIGKVIFKKYLKKKLGNFGKNHPYIYIYIYIYIKNVKQRIENVPSCLK